MKKATQYIRIIWFDSKIISLHFYKVLCSGYVVAKHKTRGCKAQNIITSWDAECGNVAFMPCTSGATLEVGTYFDICVAGYNRYKLVYDEHMG